MKGLVALTVAALPLLSLLMRAQAPSCDLSGYHAQPGLTAANGSDGLTLTWDGDPGRQLRLRLAIADRPALHRAHLSAAAALRGRRWPPMSRLNSGSSPVCGG